MRPDAAREAKKLLDLLQNSGPQYVEAVNRAITYAYGTRFLALEYSGANAREKSFVCFSEATYSNDIKSCRSTEDYIIQLFGGPIDWRSTKQKTVTTSSTEAELLCLTHTAKELYG